MKTVIRTYLINLGALWLVAKLLPTLIIHGGVKGFLIAGLAFMLANILLVPLLKILFLPLNLLTLGLFAWLSNVLALYILVSTLPYLKLAPYQFPGITFSGLVVTGVGLSTFEVAILASFMIGFFIQTIHWLIK